MNTREGKTRTRTRTDKRTKQRTITWNRVTMMMGRRKTIIMVEEMKVKVDFHNYRVDKPFLCSWV